MRGVEGHRRVPRQCPCPEHRLEVPEGQAHHLPLPRAGVERLAKGDAVPSLVAAGDELVPLPVAKEAELEALGERRGGRCCRVQIIEGRGLRTS